MRLTILFSLFVFTKVSAQELVLSGVYQGKDVFVQNPFNHTTDAFCTEKVYINDRLVFDHPKVSAYKVDLTHLHIGDIAVIRILHGKGCEPRIVNPQVLQHQEKEDFQFITAQSDNNTINWTTSGEGLGGHYYVEQYDEKEDAWQIVHETESKGSVQRNAYAMNAVHRQGENKYRVRYEAREAAPAYSSDFYFTATDHPITFHPTVVTSTIILSDSTDYEIIDYHGKIVKKGAGKEISVPGLKPGVYYLNIQHRKEKFIKK